jgi:hypothetical protein
MPVFVDKDSRAEQQEHRCDNIDNVQNKHIQMVNLSRTGRLCQLFVGDRTGGTPCKSLSRQD